MAVSFPAAPFELCSSGADLPPTQRSLDLVYESDVTVLLLDSLRLLSPPALKALLSEFSSKPNLHLLLDASDADNTATLRTVNTQLDSLNLRSPSKSTVSVISSAGAMSALEALSPDDPATPVDFLAFERGYLASGITGVKDQLARAVQPIRQRTEDGTTSQLQLQTAQYVLERTIETAAFEGAKIADGLKDGEGEIAALALKVSEVERNALDALEVSGGMMKLPKEELNAIAVDLERLFEGRLAWWKLPMRTDVINAEIAHAMERTFLVEFEDRLIFNAGRLIGLQSKLAEETDKMFSTAPFSPTNTSLSSLHSPVLRNKVAQAATETACLISPTELTSPLLARRMQITAPGGPAETLQSRAQKLVLSSGMVTSTAVAGVFFAEVMSAGNAFGAGMLGITLSGWLLQRGWIKARRKFLVDVQKRVVGGLEMDLGVRPSSLPLPLTRHSPPHNSSSIARSTPPAWRCTTPGLCTAPNQKTLRASTRSYPVWSLPRRSQNLVEEMKIVPPSLCALARCSEGNKLDINASAY